MYAQSVELLEAAIAEVNAIPDLDFVLVAGDLTKDSEPYNHDTARELLSRLRAPVFCVPGNHDQPRSEALRPRTYLDRDVRPVMLHEIPRLYGDFGFTDTQRLAYSCDPAPDVHLVALCSAKPEVDHGEIAADALAWLDADLERAAGTGREVVVMLHHSIVDHVPGEATSPLFSWFHVANAPALKQVLRRHRVRITLSGHLHIQDVKREDGLYNIATGSLASYPHAYRLFELRDGRLEVRSRRLAAIPSIADLQAYSRRETGEIVCGILREALMAAPFTLPEDRAGGCAARIRDWWPAVAAGDERFAYTAEEVGDAAVAAFVNAFTDGPPPDNDLTIELEEARRPPRT